MKLHPLRLARTLATSAAMIALVACGGADKGDESGATPDDVDQETPIAVTDEEIAAFTAPADSSLTPQQIEAYLQTSLLQYDLIRKEAPELHKKAQAMEARAKEGGALAGLRNMADAGSLLMGAGELIGGSFVRSARTLKQNPAEMEYVRDRMGEVSGYLMARSMHEAQARLPAQMRQQAEQLRGTPGFTKEQIDEMIKQADDMERELAANRLGGAAARNVEALRRARGNVTEAMWTQIGFAGGAQGIIALNGLADPADTAATRKLDEFRRIYTDALANQVSPGMENAPAEAAKQD